MLPLAETVEVGPLIRHVSSGNGIDPRRRIATHAEARRCPGLVGRRRWLLLLAMLLAGCAEPQATERLNAPPQGESEHRAEVAVYFENHRDRGLLADMAIADMHFEPYSAEISETGKQRLERYAHLLANKGGTLRYETNLSDDALIEARLGSANLYLEAASPSARLSVIRGLSGKRGMNAAEAAAGASVAKQPEPRGTAYKLNTGGGGKSGG